MKSPRLATDMCLLCREQPASKQRSHIIPKFLAKKIFIRGGFLMSTHAEKLAQKIQDSAKEDFILCPRCEGRFAITETIAANRFYNRFRDLKSRKDFPITTSHPALKGQLDLMQMTNVRPGMMRLFIYSIFWRASISSVYGYADFKLNAQLEDAIREDLDKYLGDTTKQSAVLAEQYSKRLPLPYNIITSIEEVPYDKNLIAQFDFGNGEYVLFVNDLILILYTKSPLPAGPGSNVDAIQPEVLLLPVHEWEKLTSDMAESFANRRHEVKGDTGLTNTK